MNTTWRPQAVVFDLDGLLFNTEELYQDVGGELLRRRGRVFDGPLLDQMMGRPGRVALQIMIDYHTLAEDTVEGLQAESDLIFQEILDTRLAPMPGALELLTALEAAGIPKAIGTSSRREFTVGVLSRVDWLARFEFLLTAEDVTEGKPAPEIYQRAAARLNASPDQIVVFEDSQNGCRAAVAAGARTIAVPGGHSQGHNFDGAYLIAETLADPRIYTTLQLPRC